MTTVLLLIHLFIAAALVGVVLLQRSEGGGLGIGGGGGGGFMTGRGTANFLTRITVGLAAAFFMTSIGLTLLARHGETRISPLDAPSATRPAPGAPGNATPAPGGVLDSLEKGRQRLPAVPKSE